MTRKILIAVGAALVLIVAALLIGPSFVDWNRYKPEITQQVATATGRQLAIDGDISLALLPVPKLSVAGVRFANAEGGSTAEMATLESLDVRVALLPLLGGKVQVDSVALVKPYIILETLEDGTGNWQFKPAGTPAESTEAVAPAPAASGGGFDFAFNSIRIENGTLVYRDIASGAEQRIEALDAEIGVSSLAGPFTANGKATYQGIAAGFDASVGKLEPEKPTAVDVSLRLGEPESKVGFAGTLTTGEAGVAVDGKLSGGGEKLSALLAALAPGAGGGMKLLEAPFAIEGDVKGTDKAGEIANLSVRLGDLEARGGIEFAMAELTTVKAKLQAGRLDLDKLMADIAPAAGKESEEAPAEATPSTASAAPASFALPENVDATLEIGIDAIAYNGGVVNQANLAAHLEGGELSLTKLSALLPGNSDFNLAGKLAAVEGTPSFTGALELNSDNLRGLLDWVKVTLPDIPAERLRKMSLASRVTATPNQVQIAEMDLRLDASRIAGGVIVALPGGERKGPGLGIGLAIDEINLDAYMPKPAAGAAQPAAPTEAAAGGGGLPLDALKPLANFDANVELKVGSLTLNDQVAKGLHIDATLENGNLDIRDLSVKDFAGGSGSLKGTVADLAGTPRLDSQFSLKVADATRALIFAGMANPPPKLGKLTLDGKLGGGQQDVAYDIAFSIAGIGASGKASGTASGLGAGIPLIDSDFDIEAKNAGPLLELAGIAGGGEAKLGALELKGTARSTADALTYNVAIALAGIGGQGAFDGTISDLKATPKVETKLNVSAEKPAALLGLFGVDGPTAAKLGALSLAGTLDGGTDNMALDLALGALGGNATIKGTVQAAAQPMSFDLAMTANHPELKQLAAAFVPDAKVTQQSLGPLSLSAKAVGSTEQAKISSFALKAGESDLAGSLDYAAPAGGRPNLVAKLTSSLLDITPFVPAGEGGGGGAGSGGSSDGERWSKEPLDLSALDSLDADITATMQRFVMGETRIDNLDAHLVLKDGVLTIDKFTGNSFGGAIDLAGKLASRGTPTFDGRVTASNLNTNELMGGGLLANRLQGPVSLTTDVTSSGASMYDLVNNLNGSGNLDGTITVLGKIEQQVGSVGLNLLGNLAQQKLGGAGSAIQGLTQVADAAYSAFIGVPNSLTGDFQIHNGQVNTDNLALANANARALAQGVANLPQWTMDMIATIFRAPDLNSPFLELALNGLLDAPNTKFKAFQSTSAPAGGDLLQQVIPGVTGSPDGTGTQPGGVLQQVIPGILGGGQQGGGTQPAAPGALGTEAVPEAMPAPEIAPEEIAPEIAPETVPETVPEAVPDAVPEEALPETVPDVVPEEVPAAPEAMPGATGTEAAPAPEEMPAPEAIPEETAPEEAQPEAAPAPEPQPEPELAPVPEDQSNAAPGSGGAEPGAIEEPGQQPVNNLLQNLLP